MSTNQAPKKTRVEELLEAHRDTDGRFVPTEEQKLRMQDEEPSDGQIRALRRLGVPADTILTLSKWDASELIEHLEAARHQPGSMSKPQEQALLAWRFTVDQIKDLSFYEASAVLDGLRKKKEAIKR